MSVSARAGILVTGTEVLTGRVADRNGPWLADRLEELGVDLAQIAIVGDRREDLLAALAQMAAQGYGLILTSGGLGPTADDLTAELVGEFQGREMVWDEQLQGQIEAIIARFGARWRDVDMAAMREGARKQATVPRGAKVLEPVGTAPGLIVAPPEPGGEPAAAAAAARAGQHAARGISAAGGAAHGERPPADMGCPRGPTIVVLPGPPRELQPMWKHSVLPETAAGGALSEALAGATSYVRRTLRLFGIAESEIAETLRAAEREGVELHRLEVTTCLKRGEVEVVTRYELPAEDVYEALVTMVRERHAHALFSEDGSTVDEQVAALLRGASNGWSGGEPGEAASEPGTTVERAGAAARAPGITIATAESCTGGLLAARLTELPGASEYVRGGVVAYANDVKSAQVGVPPELIERHGAVSPEVAEALAANVRERLKADVGVGITGIAGPGGGTEEKPVGTVCLSVATAERAHTRAVTLPGARTDVRERAVTVALHMVRRALADSGMRAK